MILVIGGTGFVGRALIRYLVTMGLSVRTLLRPSKTSPALPLSIPVEVAVCSLKDERSLRSAMKDVKVVYNLAGAERAGGRADLMGVDIEGTQIVAKVARQAGVNRVIYLSHLGASRASAFPLLKAKALAEQALIQSGINYTIFRSAPAYGPGDQFTIPLVRLINMNPFFLLMPANGTSVLQPIWIEDLAACLALAMNDEKTQNQVFEIGGPECLTFRDIMELIMQTINVRRLIIPITPAYLRLIALWVEQTNSSFPISSFWIDYLASDRMAPLDVLPRNFGIMPVRMAYQLQYLKG